MLNASEQVWNPFRNQPRRLGGKQLESIAELMRASYTEETGKTAFAPCGIKVRVELICERLLKLAGYSVEFVEEIAAPEGDTYSAYREGYYQRGFTDFAAKLVVVQMKPLTERFTLIHETGHALHDANFPETFTEDESPAWLEVQYNKLARYLGLPAEVFTRRFHHWNDQWNGKDSHDKQLHKILSHLVGEFEMPGRSVLFRGKDLGFISQETVDRFIRDKVIILAPSI